MGPRACAGMLCYPQQAMPQSGRSTNTSNAARVPGDVGGRLTPSQEFMTEKAMPTMKSEQITHEKNFA